MYVNISTLNYMVVLDSGFGIIYNSVPRVMVPEIQTDLVCPEACFQATTETECLQHLHAWLSHPLWKGRRMSIADAILVLSGADLDSETQQMFTNLGDLNLFILTAGMVIESTTIVNLLANRRVSPALDCFLHKKFDSSIRSNHERV